jgi:hydrogenase nickel incorporation protein HypA/HybF
MHEVSIALAIVDELAERTACQRIGRIAAVYLRVGALSAVDADALRFAWDLATDGTPASGSRLDIERVPLRIACEPCGDERTIQTGTLPICPVCGTSSTAIVSGRELEITAMEVLYDVEAS